LPPEEGLGAADNIQRMPWLSVVWVVVVVAAVVAAGRTYAVRIPAAFWGGGVVFTIGSTLQLSRGAAGSDSVWAIVAFLGFAALVAGLSGIPPRRWARRPLV
jgi:hypothetical protein